MKQTTKIAVAGLLSAAGSVLHAFAEEMGGIPLRGEPDPVNPTMAAAEEPAPTKKPRKAAAAAEKPAPPAETEPQQPAAENAATPTPESQEEGDGETQEEKDARYAENRKRIEPLIKGVKKKGSETEYEIRPQGPAVKAIIEKLSPTGKLPDLPLNKQAEFETDLESLTM